MTKSTSAKTDMATTDAQELANIEQEMADMAANISSGLKVVSDKISTANKMYTLPDGTIIGPTMQAVVLGFSKAHSYYENEQFDPNNIQEPICYSDAIGDEENVPTASIAKPMNPDCSSCPNDQFGSASIGKGKRCKEEIRVMLLPVGAKEPSMLNIPPTGIKAFSKAINSIINVNGLPVKTICRFEFNPSVTFSQPIITDAEPNPDFVAHFAKSKEAMQTIRRK